MTLDDFLKECEKKGSIPLSYRSHVVTLKGEKTINYENPRYTMMKKLAGKVTGRIKETGNPYVDDVVGSLFGEEVVIHTATGYHYGTLYGNDGENFLLGKYHFDKKLIDTFEYASESLFNEDAVVPAKDVKSISGIPLTVQEKEESYL